MLLTRSIRRKMVTGLAVLLVTLVLLSVAGISGLSNYRRMVKDLELSISRAPRNSDLIADIGRLIEPLSRSEIPPVGSGYRVIRTSALTLPVLIIPPLEQIRVRQRFLRQQREEFERKLAEVDQRVEEYYRQFDVYSEHVRRTRSGISNLDGDRKLHYLLHSRIDGNVEQCQAILPLLEDPERREAAIGYLLRMIAELHRAIREVPDPATELIDQLARDRQDYRWHLRLVWGTSVAAAIMFVSLAFCAHRWIVRPIRDLQRGACRVAAGDFDYRVDLATNDEISSLANAFNHMTQRFQTVTEDLDRQVQQQTQQLVQSARLAGVGFLAAGVAHEINNPLHAIATAAEGLESRLAGNLDGVSEADQAVIRDYLSMMQSESARCRTITEKLLDFARGKVTERNQYDVTAIIRETVSVLKHVGKFRDRKILFDVDDPCYAYVNGSEIKQVVLNLVANALEATEADGLVTISLNETLDFVEIIFKDDGCGMTADVLTHIFDPFYSTKQNKAEAKGTGLGLSISHRIVQDHQGTLEAMSDGPNRGSTFRLRLPKTSAATRAA